VNKKCIICGTRTWRTPTVPGVIGTLLVAEAVDISDFTFEEIVTGGALGIDEEADFWARENKYCRTIMPYDVHLGKSGGPNRNQRMVDYADMLIAIPGPESKGTWNCIRLAQKKGIPVYIHKELLERQ